MSDASIPSFPSVLAQLEHGPGLDAASARRVFDAIFAGEWSAAQIAGLLVALRLRGETPEVVTAAARALRARMVDVAHDMPQVFDNSGTGGDGQRTRNI
jgi:anthranilate phosphoribosyltransferase